MAPSSGCPEILNWFERHDLNPQLLNQALRTTGFSLAAAVNVSASIKHSIWDIRAPTDCCKITLDMLHGEIFFSIVLKQVSSHFSCLGECWNAEASEMFCRLRNIPSAWEWVEKKWIFFWVAKLYILKYIRFLTQDSKYNHEEEQQ